MKLRRKHRHAAGGPGGFLAHRARSAMGALTMLAVGIAPFAIYLGVRDRGEPAPTGWPQPVALVTVEKNALTSVGVIVAPANTVIAFPVESSLIVPNRGRLRALSAYRIGGAGLLARSLESTLGIDVPYYAVWEAASLEKSSGVPATNLGGRVNDVLPIVQGVRQGQVRKHSAPGSAQEGAYFTTYLLDLPALRRLLQAPAQAPVPTPTPTPTVEPSPTPTSTATDRSVITITVLNQGAPAGSATKTQQELRDAGFTLARVGDPPPGRVTGNFIYWTVRQSDAELVATAIDEPVRILRAPAGYRSADVTVVLGQSGSTSTSRRTSTPTSRRTPTTDATLG